MRYDDLPLSVRRKIRAALPGVPLPSGFENGRPGIPLPADARQRVAGKQASVNLALGRAAAASQTAWIGRAP